MSFNECEQTLQQNLDSQRSSVEEASSSESKRQLDLINTGPQNGDTTATEDFNPKLQVSADSLGLSGESEAGLRLGWNDIARDLLKNQFFGNDGSYSQSGIHHKLVVTLEEATLFEPLNALITDDAVRSQLEEQLNDFDNVTLDLRFSYSNDQYGRNIQNHSDLISLVQRASLDRVEQELNLRAQAYNELNEILRQSGVNDFDPTKPLQDVLGRDFASQFVNALERALGAQRIYRSTYDSVSRQNGLDELLLLISNQPQILLSVMGNNRDELVGPDEYSLKFTYEMGGANINNFKRYQNNRCGGGALNAAAMVNCLKNYVALNEETLHSNGRLSLSIEYTEKDSYDFAQGALALNLESEKSLIANLTYGRYVDLGLREFGPASQTNSRLDISASYEDVKDDPLRQDRALATITLSQELDAGLFFTVGINWANKSEFIGMGDKEVSATAGLSYKLSRQ